MAKSFSQSALLNQNLKGREDKVFICHSGTCLHKLKICQAPRPLKHVPETLSTLSAHISFLHGIALCPSQERHLQELKSFAVSLEEKFLPTGNWFCFFPNWQEELLLSFPFLHPATRAHARSLGQPQGYRSLLEATSPMAL